MAAGLTYDWEQSAQQIIDDALANVGAIGPGKTATGHIRDHALRALNRVVHSLDQDGMFLWRSVRRTLTTTDGTASYSLAADVLSIDEPMSFIRSGGTSRSQVRLMSRDDYMSLSSRTDEAREPTRAYFERTLTAVNLLLWPTPSTTGDTLEYACVVKGKDFDTLADTPDFLSSWIKALVDGLTAELAPAHNQPQMSTLFAAKFQQEVDRQHQRDTEHGNLILVPFGH